ncbi:MAG: transcriptional repressor LexA [Spirochaetota bacterium]|nr:transcriptional repressor LexA [Spirochaetota bacterium]
MKQMTRKQQEVYEFVLARIESQGFPPTVREIGESFSISVKGAYDHLKAIERKGFIKCSSSKSRAIEIMDRLPADIRQGERMLRVPLMGSSSAGMPLLAEQNIEEEFYLPRAFLGESSDVFALRVRGDSMTGAGIMNGDLVLVRMQTHASDGDIVVALIDSETTIKRFFRRQRGVVLKPENPAYKEMPLSAVDILGKVVWVFRRIQ